MTTHFVGLRYTDRESEAGCLLIPAKVEEIRRKNVLLHMDELAPLVKEVQGNYGRSLNGFADAGVAIPGASMAHHFLEETTKLPFVECCTYQIR